MSEPARRPKVLFLCIYNSARSQMAEGLLRALFGDRYEACSAGASPAGLNAWAVKAMAEIGIDISDQYSKSVDVFAGGDFDYVVTVCGADQKCPAFRGEAKRLHWDIADPGEKAGVDTMASFRETRDDLKRRIERAFGAAGIRKLQAEKSKGKALG